MPSICVYADLEPTSADLTLECSSRINPETGQSYDLTVKLVFSPNFTPIFIEQAINNFQLFVTAYETGGSGFPIDITATILLGHDINGTLLREHTFVQLSPRELRQEYRIGVRELASQ